MMYVVRFVLIAFSRFRQTEATRLLIQDYVAVKKLGRRNPRVPEHAQRTHPLAFKVYQDARHLKDSKIGKVYYFGV